MKSKKEENRTEEPDIHTYRRADGSPGIECFSVVTFPFGGPKKKRKLPKGKHYWDSLLKREE